MTPTTELTLIGGAWNTLQPFLGVDKCVGCECLQAALTELLMALEALPPSAEQERLLTAVRGGLDLLNLHGCLGCDPCGPADALVSFYRARDATAMAGRCACGSSCTDGVPASFPSPIPLPETGGGEGEGG
ncbi:MAG: hypothetical protein HY803_08250 [candidate division NC10 bacterium]|nr:hypothetical protein [candidate division NC10 bacterium]